MSGVLRKLREQQEPAPVAEYVVELGPGCRLWVRPASPEAEARIAKERNAQTQRALVGQAVIVRWEGVVVKGDLRRWRPAMRPDGTLPFSADNAGLLYMRASTVRDAVDAALCSDNVTTT